MENQSIDLTKIDSALANLPKVYEAAMEALANERTNGNRSAMAEHLLLQALKVENGDSGPPTAA